LRNFLITNSEGSLQQPASPILEPYSVIVQLSSTLKLVQ